MHCAGWARIPAVELCGAPERKQATKSASLALAPLSLLAELRAEALLAELLTLVGPPGELRFERRPLLRSPLPPPILVLEE
jgi:hypothetical protein